MPDQDLYPLSGRNKMELAGWKLGLSFALTATFLCACFFVILAGHSVAGTMLAVFYLIGMMIANAYSKPKKETCYVCGRLLAHEPHRDIEAVGQGER